MDGVQSDDRSPADISKKFEDCKQKKKRMMEEVSGEAKVSLMD